MTEVFQDLAKPSYYLCDWMPKKGKILKYQSFTRYGANTPRQMPNLWARYYYQERALSSWNGTREDILKHKKLQDHNGNFYQQAGEASTHLQFIGGEVLSVKDDIETYLVNFEHIMPVHGISEGWWPVHLAPQFNW